MGFTRSDVVIVGGGPAGAATALAVCARGLSVTVLERRDGPTARIGETVPADLRPALERLGAWPGFGAQGHLRSHGSASAWGTAELAVSHGRAGWHLDRRRFESLLLDEAERAGADVRRGSAARAVADGAGDWAVAAVDGDGRVTEVRAGFLVDATGRAAVVARWLGARRLCHDRLVCAYAELDPAPRPLGARSMVESVADGWWYATALPDGRALAGLFTVGAILRHRGCSSPRGWHQALRRSAHAFDALASPGPPASVRMAACTPHCLDRPAGVDWLAVGDAAASYDPLASAGITLAVRAGEEAAAVIVARRGDRRAPARQARRVQQRFTGYLLERRELYARERRWADSPFWAPRRARPGAGIDVPA